MRLIKLTQGKFAKVDDEDFDALSRFKWRFHSDGNSYGNGYAIRNVTNSDGSRTTQPMHKFLLPVKSGLTVDHKDGDGINNQRRNLRPATKRQQKQNSRKHKIQISAFKGISPRAGGKWVARIKINGIHVHLGIFSDPRTAHKTYIEAARKAFGEFASS
jgi:hypothetical protein